MVRCADCGLLTRGTGSDRPDVEVGKPDREKGTRAISAHGRKPLCTVEEESGHDLPAEYGKPDDHRREQQFHAVIHKERGCPCFLKYERGLTPSQHRQKESERKEKADEEANRIADRGFNVGHEKAKQRRGLKYAVAASVIAGLILVFAEPLKEWAKWLFGPPTANTVPVTHATGR